MVNEMGKACSFKYVVANSVGVICNVLKLFVSCVVCTVCVAFCARVLCNVSIARPLSCLLHQVSWTQMCSYVYAGSAGTVDLALWKKLQLELFGTQCGFTGFC